MKLDNVMMLNEVDVLNELNSGAVLVTASQPLAVDWKRRLVAESAAASTDSRVFDTPAVISWAAWLNEIVSGIGTMPVALNRAQEGWLWQQVIRTELMRQPDVSAQSAASIRGLAKHASEAYMLMQEYQIDVVELTGCGDESEALATWIGALQQRFSSGVLAGRMLAAEIGLKLLHGLDASKLPESIVLAGFDILTPLQRTLLEAMQKMGVRVSQIEQGSKAMLSVVHGCADAPVECEHIAQSTQTLLATAPSARIAIVTSDAIKDVSLLQRCLDDVLMPESRYAAAGNMQAVVMAGDKLADVPMIQQLLNILALAGENTLSFEVFSNLLFLPWLKGFETERFQRAALDAKFRQQNRHHLSLKSLLNSSYVQPLPQLLSVLKALAAWRKNKQTANAWVKSVHELLKAAGFLHVGSDQEIQRSNQEIRQMNAFRDVLTALVAVDVFDEKLGWTQFLSLLRSGCAEVRLAKPAKFTNVVVVPLSQLGGLRFDHVLLMGLDEEVFPPALRPYPLLPASVQKKYALPMSNGALVYDSAVRLWDMLLQSAPQIKISYARQRNDKELLASSFVAEFEVESVEQSESQISRLQMQDFDDVSAVPLPVGANVRGGTSIIRNQSACPFRAFATHRLGITALGDTTPGIEPGSKGSLIHLALEFIWKKLERQSALAALTDDEALDLIDAAIMFAWDKAYVVADARIRAYEKKRMLAVLLEWFALELNRPAFKVESIEQEYEMHLPHDSEQQFTVRIKADRMDVDISGRRILIDYKTGAKQSTRKWLVDDEMDAGIGRIEEPQLPQYALAAGLAADDAVAFARVRRGDMSFEGLCGTDIGIKGIVACDGKRNAPDDWQDVLDDWKVHIDALAYEFVEGRCDVSPRDKNACNYCGFEAICRIEEVGLSDHQGEET